MQTDTDQNIKLFLHNRKFIIISVILVWASVFMLFSAFKPQINQIQTKKDTLNQKRSELNQLSKKNLELEQILNSSEFAQKEKVNEVLPSHKPLLELLSNLNQAARQHEITFVDFEISPGEIASDSAEADMDNLVRQAKQQQTETKASLEAKEEEEESEGSENDQDKKALQKSDEVAYSGKGYNQLVLELSIRGRSDEVDDFMGLMEKIAPLTTITEFRISREDPLTTQAQASPSASSSVSMSTATMIMSTYYYERVITTTPSSSLPSVGDEEMKVFETIQKFRPTELKPQKTLKSGDLEDLFGVDNLVEQLQ